MSGGLTAFLVILGLAVAATILFRSMLTHLRRVPPSFDDDDDADDADESDAQSSTPG